MKNILITGYPRVGKTTAIKKIIKNIPIEKAGFLTEEMRDEKGRRIGFEVTTIAEGKRGLLAHVDKPSNYVVGKYFVQMKEFEEIVLSELARNTRLMVIDEIGKMELYSEKFAKAIMENLDKGNVLATITMKGGGIIEQIKRREDVEIIEITIENRDKILKRIIEKIMEKISQ